MKTRTSNIVKLTVLAMLTAVFVIAGFADKAQAAEPKTHTYVVDKKTGIEYPTAIRIYANSHDSDSIGIYLPNANYKVSAKASSNLIAKVSRVSTITREDSFFSGRDYSEDTKYQRTAGISVFGAKEGTGSVKFTVKNEKGKTVLSKSVKVFVGYAQRVEKATFNGKEFDYNSILTKKSSGKFSVKLGKDFSLKKIEYGNYDANGNMTYKTIKNKGKVALTSVGKFTEEDYNSITEDSYYGSASGTEYDYIYPMTEIKVTVYDKKLKTVETVTYYVFRQN
ncbi:MAG: hypothetical protein IK078_00595 [Lachnospiraceae bacterium]|nr:hypothetical protein [Lachnospiraceae bacterium]